MRIAVPIDGGRVHDHFGQSNVFRVFTVVGDPPAIAGHEDAACGSGDGCAAASAFLKANDVQVVLVGGIGPGAVAHLQAAGMKVVTGAAQIAPEQLVGDYLAGRFKTAGPTCSGHDHHHDHGAGAQQGGCGCSGQGHRHCL